MIPTPFGYPLYIMAKPAGPVCNMACRYCYYLDKRGLFPSDRRCFMTERTLETYIRSYIEAQTIDDVQFTWHGGEATLRPLDFYRRAMALQRRHGRGKRISNCLQTNGMLLDDEWCRFLRDNGWLVGISIDGPADVHDHYRRTTDGRPSHGRVMEAIARLQAHGVEWNAMAVVNDRNADDPVGFYEFFRNIGCRYIQFTPVVERISAAGTVASATDTDIPLAPFSVTPEKWGRFLTGVFDRWVRTDVGTTFVQIFDAVLAGYVGCEPGLCTMSASCGHAGVMEHNGDVYSCDHFVFPEYRLGNIHRESLTEMMYSERQQQFGAAKRGALPPECLTCRWSRICNGECPRNRFAIASDGTPRLNYLCSGYRAFFAHSEPYFRYMADALRAGRPAADVMRLF